ncbi:response regulator [Puniceicoccales bacterium CK1056]|uniref:histidine kinase n=1 Tax=Oceanipulchritudo coccoides TaxID=2706888 RepID=A0A6B2M2K4_9BACT|nr:hybrid sensor histidine kinase/response regulator [Oceanipulchritudo coccoides]NDV62973.1 response regulator [Oceanipulchritudo coccoides]
MTNKAEQESLLIVDDTPANIDLLVDLLSSNYRTRVATSGEKALSLCAQEAPDLILLDIMMPGMDGYEVCRKLKEVEETKNIPIIFVTAKGEIQDETKGLALGAVDYISKPITPAVVLARVETHLKVNRQRLKIEAAYNQLRELEALRDNLVHMVVHDMRGPLALMSGHLEILKMNGNLGDRENGHVDSITKSCMGLIEMVSSLLDVSRFDNDEMPLDMADQDIVLLAEETVVPYQTLKYGPSVVFESTLETLPVNCDQSIIERVIANLIGNAVKFTPPDGTVRLELEKADHEVKVSVSDTGSGISPEFHEKIFERFGQVEMQNKKQKYSTGLGLTFCKLAVEAHGGTIGVESEVGNGSTFWFRLPIR